MGRGQRDGQRQPPVPRKRARPSWNRQDADPDDFAPFASWDGDDFSRIYGDHDDEPDDSRRATVVVPAITLPSLPSVQRPTHAAFDDDYASDTSDVRDDYRDEYHAIPQKPPRKRRNDKHIAPSDASDHSRRKLVVAPANKMAVAKKPKVPAEAKVVLVPGTETPQRGVRYRARRIGSRLVGPLHVVRSHRKALTVFALALMLIGVVANTTGLLSDAGLLSQNSWNALASFGGPPPTPTPIPAPDSTSASHYVQKYGFDYPSNPQSIGSAEWNRLAFMLPYAYRATAAYDQRYHASIEPEMLVWWTHSEGIKGRINYSNCANNPPLAGYNYFNNIQNCPHASFWQLGFGNQFSVIYVLRNAFSDLYGNPNDPQLVQKVGQWVLNYDRSQGTVPACGGYSCTFPARTIDSIMSGIDTSLGVQTQDNWWASVLSRDPAINCYMIAHALTYFNHAATRNWIGCYYYEPCWGYESNKLGDILAAWPGLRRAAHL